MAKNSNKKPFYKKWWVIVVVIVIIVGAIGCSGSKKDNTNTESKTDTNVEKQTTVEETKNKKEDTKITYENFLNVKMGDSYENVVALLGEGTESSSVDVNDIKTVMYEWKGSGISNMNVTVQNGEVTGKAQLGLQTMDAKITMDLYNQVQNGMSYDEVKDILGEGQIVSQNKIMDMESTMYSYMNKDGSNANFTFSNGKLDLKAQFNLN